MDGIADIGSSWFCAAAHVAASPTFEMQACGNAGTRYVIGVTTAAALVVLAIIGAWRVGARRAG